MKLKSWLRALRAVPERIVIRNRMAREGAVRVILGAGGTNYRGWITTDYPALDVVDRRSWLRLFQPGQIDALLAEHVLEHLTDEQLAAALCNAYGFLKFGGRFRIAVPDGFHPDKDYIEMVRPGGSGPGADDHKQLFNYQSLSGRLQAAGFAVRLIEWFDENKEFRSHSFADEDGFVSRSSRNDERNADRPLAFTSLILDAYKISASDDALLRSSPD